jgi:hypothetical protein
VLSLYYYYLNFIYSNNACIITKDFTACYLAGSKFRAKGKAMSIQESFITLDYDAEINAVVGVWTGEFASFEQIKHALEQGLELFAAKKAEYWLADTRKMPPFGKETETWINTEWVARAKELGLKRLAMVAPESALPRLTLNSVVTNSHAAKERVSVFATLESAKAWIKGNAE